MKTVKINLYKFKELDEKAKEEALFNHFNEYIEYKDCASKHNPNFYDFMLVSDDNGKWKRSCPQDDCVYETFEITPLAIYSRGDTEWVEGLLDGYLFTKDGLSIKEREE